MTPTHRTGLFRRLGFSAAIAWLAHTTIVTAATWDGGGTDNLWSTAPNWAGDAPLVAPAAVAFAGSSRLAPHNDFPALRVTSLTFATGAAAFTLEGEALELRGNIVNESTQPQVVRLDLDLPVTDLRTLTLTAGGGNLTLAGRISGKGSLTLAGSGHLTLAGDNSYAGSTTFKSGQTLNLNHAQALGSGVLKAGGSGTFDNTSGVPLVLANDFELSNGSPTFTGSANLTLAGTTTIISANRTITVAAGTLTLGGLEAGGTSPTTRTFTKDGAGTLVLAGAAGASFQGGFVLGGGTLVLGAPTAMGSGPFTFDAGTLQTARGLDGANAIANAVTLAHNSATVSGTNNLTFAGRVTLAGASRVLTSSLANGRQLTLAGSVFLSELAGTGRTLTLAGTGDTTISGAIADFDGTGTAGSLTVNNSATTTLSGANTYGGATTVNAGVLLLADDQALPGGIGSSGGTGVLTLGGGVLGLGAGGFLRALGLGAGQVRFTGGGGFAAFGADRRVNLGGAAAGVTWGSGQFVPSGQALLLGASNATHRVTFENPLALGGAVRTIRVEDGAGAVDAELGGVISGGTANDGLVKTGSGTLRLSAPNTYGGATTVSNGLLLVNRSVGNGQLRVVRDAGLGGTGTVASARLTLEPGARLRVAIGAAGISEALTVVGELDVTAVTLDVAETNRLDATRVYAAVHCGSHMGRFAGHNLPDGWRLDYAAADRIRIAAVPPAGLMIVLR